MSLPKFDDLGDLPVGAHRATLDEVIVRFGGGTTQRQNVTMRLRRIYELARSTEYLERFVIFGSYISAKPEPNDLDIILILRDDFVLAACPQELKALFDHQRADQELGASIFWIRPALLLLETLDEFIAHWQVKRDGTRRGIGEVTL